MRDNLLIGLIFAAMGLGIVAVASFVLQYFVALKSPPSQRAAWTAGLAYLAATAVFLFGGPAGAEYASALICLPGALIAFWFWRSEFRRAWINNPDDVPEGQSIANDDWRIGLLRLLALVVVAVGAVLIKRALRGY